MKKKNILVTGGSGFLGAALVRSLISDGHHVRILDNNLRGKTSRLESIRKDIEFFEGDIRNSDVVNKATKGVEWVYHLAFVNGTRNFYERPGLVLDVGIRGALNTMDAAMKYDVEKYIVASSSEVYNEPQQIPTSERERALIPDVSNARFSYSGGKLATELLTFHYLKHGPEKLIFRPHNVYGPDMGWEHVVPEFFKKIRIIKERKKEDRLQFPIQGSGLETRAFCFIDDAVAGIKICSELGKDAEIYNVGVDNETRICDLAKKIGKLCDVELELIAESILEGSTTRRCPDISKLGALGYVPSVNLDQGLHECANYYLEASIPKLD